MSEHLAAYLRKIEAARRLGNDTEHTHRPALQALLEALNDAIAVTNEPKRIACGAPDLVVSLNNPMPDTEADAILQKVFPNESRAGSPA